MERKVGLTERGFGPGDEEKSVGMQERNGDGNKGKSVGMGREEQGVGQNNGEMA